MRIIKKGTLRPGATITVGPKGAIKFYVHEDGTLCIEEIYGCNINAQENPSKAAKQFIGEEWESFDDNGAPIPDRGSVSLISEDQSLLKALMRKPKG